MLSLASVLDTGIKAARNLPKVERSDRRACEVLRHDRECAGDGSLIEDAKAIAGAFPIC